MWWIVMGIVVLVAAGLGVGLLLDGPSRREAAGLTFAKIDFDSLQDGTYTGEFVGGTSHLRDTKVSVMIADGDIAEVKVLKGAVDKEGTPVELTKGKTIQQVFDAVSQAKTLDVDVISGATLTTKTHLKALEHALNAAQLN